MKDDGDDSGRPIGKAAKDKRQERLKLALRENLKRRKSRARERGDFTAPSATSDDAVGEGGEEGPAK